MYVCTGMYLCCLPIFTTAHSTLILEVLTRQMVKTSCIYSDTADGTGR